MEQQVKALISQATSDLSGAVTPGAVISVGVRMASQVNAMKHLTDQKKTELAVEILVSALEALKGVEIQNAGEESLKKSIAEKYSVLETTAKSALPAAIDVAMDAYHRKLTLKKTLAPFFLRWFVCGQTSVLSVAEKVVGAKGALESAAAVVEKALPSQASKIAAAVAAVEKVAAEAVELGKEEPVAPAPAPAPAAVDLSGVHVDLSGASFDLSGASFDLSGGSVPAPAPVAVDLSGAAPPVAVQAETTESSNQKL